MIRIINFQDQPWHANTVAEWIYEEFIDGQRAGVTFEDVLARFETRKRKSLPCTLLAVENVDCIGIASLLENDLANRPDLTPWLGEVVVKKAHRGLGIGQQLVQAIEQLAAEMGYPRIYLRTEHAAKYYEKRGWDFVQTVYDRRFGIKTHIYQKSLESFSQSTEDANRE